MMNEVVTAWRILREIYRTLIIDCCPEDTEDLSERIGQSKALRRCACCFIVVG
jgi:hypothetical protein